MKISHCSLLLLALAMSSGLGRLSAQQSVSEATVEFETNTEESFIPNYAVAGSYFTFVGESDFSDAGGSLSQMEAGIDANLPLFMGDSLRITGGIQYRWNQLDFSGAPEPLGSQSFDLHRLNLPFNLWQDFNDRWKLWVRLQPGLFSDFEDVGSDDFTLTSLALLSYRWTDSLRISFGGYYSRDLGEERLLPALGVIYEPNPQWSLGLTFPRASVVYAPSEDWLIAGRALLSGSGWNISDPAGGANDVDLDYQSLRIGMSVDRRISGPWWAYLDGGVQMAQEISIEGADYRYEEELDSTYFISGGVKLRF